MKQETDPRLKLNLEGIHLDMDDLLEKYDCKPHSISDGTEIQQIALFCQNNRNDYRKPVLTDMIKPMFSFAGLYPHVMTSFDILPDAHNLTEEQKEMFERLKLDRDERKKNN